MGHLSDTLHMRPNVAAIIRQTRVALGWTQVAAAAAYGCNVSAWRHWEAGRRTPSIATLTRIADKLGCDVGVVLTSRKGENHAK